MTTLYTTTRTSHRYRPLTSVVLPTLADHTDASRKDIYMAFIHALRTDPHRRMEVRVLCAIHQAADITENSDAYVTRVLVDLGLRSPRLALPGDFLDHADAHLLRRSPSPVPVPPSYKELAEHWRDLGDDVYAFLPSLVDGAKEPQNIRV
ncbi:MAG TPA: hypothetical protein VIN59_07795 [Alphaproteobacteria bacterium]